MNIAKLTQVAKENGYGKAFERSNGEICVTNKSGKVILTFNADLTVKFSRWTMAEVPAFIEALTATNAPAATSSNAANIVDSGLGFAMSDTKSNWELCAKDGYDAIEI